MALKLGYKNFVELGYYRMARTDYNAENVANYRKQIKESVVPLVSKLMKRQANRLNLDHLTYYDEAFEFQTGNAVPKGDANWIIENGRKMYQELSPETAEFFEFMIENNLMDLVAKKGKKAGAIARLLRICKHPLFFQISMGLQGILTC